MEKKRVLSGIRATLRQAQGRPFDSREGKFNVGDL